MSSDCVFCKIVSGQIPGEKLYHDEQVTAFRDIQPSAPTHVLVIPNRHIASINDLGASDESLVGHLFTVARQVALNEGIADSGYRIIINTGPDAGQAVPHLHVHILGGQPMRHPLG